MRLTLFIAVTLAAWLPSCVALAQDECARAKLVYEQFKNGSLPPEIHDLVKQNLRDGKKWYRENCQQKEPRQWRRY